MKKQREAGASQEVALPTRSEELLEALATFTYRTAAITFPLAILLPAPAAFLFWLASYYVVRVHEENVNDRSRKPPKDPHEDDPMYFYNPDTDRWEPQPF